MSGTLGNYVLFSILYLHLWIFLFFPQIITYLLNMFHITSTFEYSWKHILCLSFWPTSSGLWHSVKVLLSQYTCTWISRCRNWKPLQQTYAWFSNMHGTSLSHDHAIFLHFFIKFVFFLLNTNRIFSFDIWEVFYCI